MSGRELNLDGGEVSIIKALGLSSTEMTGEDLMDRVSSDMLPVEIIDCLKGLISQGYVDSDKSSFYSIDEFKVVSFRVNSGYSKAGSREAGIQAAPVHSTNGAKGLIMKALLDCGSRYPGRRHPHPRGA